jgi:RNA polymerase sigma-70 factor (ECF subfamily)
MTGLASRLAPQSDVDDVVQEALASAWQRRRQFDPNRGTARAWLLTLTAEQARRFRRRSARMPVLVPEASTAGSDRLPDVDLHRALCGLSARQRLAVELFYYLGLPVREIALVMGCAEGTVKSTLADARARLRTTLGGGGHERS